MAEAGLFVGWGQAVRGREAKALSLFSEAIEWWGAQQAAGAYESFEVVLLGPHGGDLFGFALVRGSHEEMAALRAREDFQQLIARATMVVDGVGLIDAVVGDGLANAVATFQAVTAEYG